MPCVDRNGNTVPGVEGQCPMGSTFRRPNGAEIEAMKVYDLPPGSYGRDDEGTSTGEGLFNGQRMNKDDISQLLNYNAMDNREPLFDLPEYAQDIAIVGSVALGRGKGDKKALMQSLSRLLNKGKSIGNKAVNTFKNRNSKDFTPVNANNLKEVLMNPTNAKLLTKMGIGGTTLVALQRQLFGDKSAAKGDGLTEQQKLLMASGSDSGRRGKATLNPQNKSRYGGEFTPTTMQKLGANLKNPDWWKKSMSGLKGDTRLSRLGVLMDYYGRTPKGRAAVDMPAKVFAANEAAAQKNELASLTAKAKAAKEAAGDSYDWSFANVNKAAEGFFNDKFGFDWWGGKDKEDTKAKFMSDLTDEKARYPQLNLQELMELMMSKYPNRYK